MSSLHWKVQDLNSETSGDSKNTFLHCDVLDLADRIACDTAVSAWQPRRLASPPSMDLIFFFVFCLACVTLVNAIWSQTEGHQELFFDRKPPMLWH